MSGLEKKHNAMKQIEVAAAIIRRGDRIFATQRGYGEFKDWWEFPGGILETHAVHHAVMRFLTDVRLSINAL